MPAAPTDPATTADRYADRLGFGPAPGETARIGLDPAGWLAGQGLSAANGFAPAPDVAADPAWLAARASATPALARPAGEIWQAFGPPARRDADDPEAKKALRRQETLLVQQAASLRLTRAVAHPWRAREVMSQFWADHFNLYGRKGPVGLWLADFDQYVLRPHALGRFADLLPAVARHPAMLAYLDNQQSRTPGAGLDAGPANGRRRVRRVFDDPVMMQVREDAEARAAAQGNGGNGNARRAGLNENYGRELLELHTLGVNGGYTQADVTETARLLTGWRYTPDAMASARTAADGFAFAPRLHDPGEKTILGTRYGAGEDEGLRLLNTLAHHPATARHLARKLVVRFVTDTPPPALVDRVAQAYLAHDTAIAPTLAALVESPEFASAPPRFRSPWKQLVASVRATGRIPNGLDDNANGARGFGAKALLGEKALQLGDARALLGWAAQAGEGAFQRVTPDGWPQASSAWLNPDALDRRVELALLLGRGRGLDAAPSPDLVASATGLPAPRAVALLLANPESLRA